MEAPLFRGPGSTGFRGHLEHRRRHRDTLGVRLAATPSSPHSLPAMSRETGWLGSQWDKGGTRPHRPVVTGNLACVLSDWETLRLAGLGFPLCTTGRASDTPSQDGCEAEMQGGALWTEDPAGTARRSSPPLPVTGTARTSPSWEGAQRSPWHQAPGAPRPSPRGEQSPS